MKIFNRILVMVFIVSLSACNSSQKSPQQSKGEIVEVMAPKAMYEVLKEAPYAQLIDVRTKDEYGVSHLKNSQNICITDDDFKTKVASLDKNAPIYVYCKKGGRSARAAKVLKEMGFTKIYDLQGGITAWDKARLDKES